VIDWQRDLSAIRSHVSPGTSTFLYTRNDGAVARTELSSPNSPVRVVGIGHPKDKTYALGVNDARGMFASGDRLGEARLWSDARDSLGWTRSDIPGGGGFADDSHVVLESGAGREELVVLAADDGRKLFSIGPHRDASKGPVPLVTELHRYPGEARRRFADGWQCLSLEGEKTRELRRDFPDPAHLLRAGPFPWMRDEKLDCVRIFARDMARETARFPVTSRDFQGAYVSPDERRVALEFVGALRLFDLATKAEIPLEDARTLGLKGAPNFSPGGDFLAISLKKGSAIVWSAATGERHAIVDGPAVDLVKAASTADGKRIIAIDRRARLYLWDAASRTLLGSIPLGYGASNSDFDIDPQGKRLLAFIKHDSPPKTIVRMISLAK
ncbi:MAG TPA: WD40 repeat domain-containing protein, partial [Planctomycetia bacterium]|nr:WD40 repeat domain-containing protein [Planctomycetia bacterium]